MSHEELLELGTKPIRDGAPTGDPIRDTPEYEALQLEIRKLELPDRPTPDWAMVIRSSRALLAERSKDLQVACWLAAALLEQDGLSGFTAGLTVLRDLVTGFWDALYPEAARMRRRTAALEWLAERAAARLALASGVSREAVALALERVEQLGVQLGPRIERGDALLGEVRRALNDLSTGPAEPAAPAAAAASSAAVAVSAPSEVTNDAELEQSLAAAKPLLRAAGEYLRRAQPGNPLGYRLPRLAAWMGVKQLPPNSAGKTSIPPYQPADLGARFDQMLAGGNYAALLDETEGRIAGSVLWLDPHRYSCEALERMGPDYAHAAEAIAQEVGALLKRVPGLVELKFANDAPLASGETRAWIERRVLAAAQAAAPAGAPATAVAGTAGPLGGEAFEETRQKAWQMARQKQLSQAAALLEGGAASAGSLRDRATWKLEIARMCMEAGHHETALAQLETLDEELARSSLEDWEPGLCVEVIKGLLQSRQKVISSRGTPLPEDSLKTRELVRRLCRIDVVAALELNGRK